MTTVVSCTPAFHQVLFATDLSDASVNALNYAKAIAKRYASSIVLLHVCPPANPIAIPEGGWVDDGTAKPAQEQIEALGETLRSEGFPAVALCAFGPIEREILSLAQARHADIIVLGTHGRQGLERLLFGSQAEALMRHAACPVLTVGPAATSPAEAWSPRNILCASSLDPHSVQAAVFAYRLAQQMGAAFTLFHVEDTRYPATQDGWEAFENAFHEALPEGEAKDCPIRSFLSPENPATNIVEIAVQRRADLLVLGAKHAMHASTHFRQGILPQVLLHAPCPVLTVHSD